MATKTKRQVVEQNYAKAMSHGDRARALKILNERTASTNEIANQLGVDVRKLGFHIRKLHEWEFIEEVGSRRKRGAIETFYRATNLPIVYSDEWDEVPEERRPGLVGEFTQAIIDNVVRSVEAGVLGADGDFWIGPIPQVMDREALQELVALYDEYKLKAADIAADYGERQGNGEAGESVHVVSAVACFPVPPPSKKA
jgi:DNA-binding transcriptional ArsR family regulator